MPMRKIVRIDEEKCDGCGLCVPSCAEGAIQIINGKAKVVSETYCDGLGACLGHCPQDAITVEEREASDFDEEAVKRHLAAKKVAAAPKPAPAPVPAFAHGGGCPGKLAQMLQPREAAPAAATGNGAKPAAPAAESQLRNWPLQMHLVPIKAPYYENAKLLIAADCVPFAYPNFHGELLAGRTLLIGCPKLDETDVYHQKLVEIFRQNEIQSVEIAYMEVPCCFGLVQLVRMALRDAGVSIPLSLVKVGLRGEIRERTSPEAVLVR